MDPAAFRADVRTSHATLHNLEPIGEATTLGIDDSLIWMMVRRSIPDLMPRLSALLAESNE